MSWSLSPGLRRVAIVSELVSELFESIVTMTSSTYLRLTELNDDNKEKHKVLRRIASLEASSYPIEEGATESMLRFRLENARPFFLLAYLSPTSEESELLVGFVNGTLTISDELSEESMTGHDPNGSVLCIHSVVIDPAFRRMGLGTRMVKQYTATIWESQVQVKRILLIAKAPLVKFYVSCGFIVNNLSPIVHGKDPWFELELDCEAARRPVIIQVMYLFLSSQPLGSCSICKHVYKC